MDRLQKKCFIASAGVHLLLVLILVIGPAFQSSKSNTEEMPVLDFIPFKTVDAKVSGGGNPNGSLPRPMPQEPKPPTPPPQPIVQPEPARPPAPEPQVSKPAPPPQPNPESLEPSPERKPRKIEVSTTQIIRKHDTRAEAKAKAEAQAREEARAERATRQRWAKELGQMADHITGDVSASTSLELKGPGGGGVPYANFNQSVMSAYQRVWRQQQVEAEEATTVETTVTIARDGTVVSARITRPSGNPSVDRAVQATLDRVRYAAPLPDDAKEDQRTVPVTFYAKPKRSIG